MKHEMTLSKSYLRFCIIYIFMNVVNVGIQHASAQNAVDILGYICHPLSSPSGEVTIHYPVGWKVTNTTVKGGVSGVIIQATGNTSHSIYMMYAWSDERSAVNKRLTQKDLNLLEQELVKTGAVVEKADIITLGKVRMLVVEGTGDLHGIETQIMSIAWVYKQRRYEWMFYSYGDQEQSEPNVKMFAALIQGIQFH